MPDLMDRLVMMSIPEGMEIPDPLTGEPVERWRTELSPAARERLTRPGYAVPGR